MQAIKQGGSVRLLSRNGADYTRRFAPVAEAVAALRPARLHLDGELVAMDPQGPPSFQALQARGPLPPGWSFGLYAFDLLRINGRALRDQPLSERRSRLADLPNGGVVRFSATFKGSAEAVARALREQGLEGVVAKRVNSRYEAGKRSGAWLKLPLKQQSVFVIGG